MSFFKDKLRLFDRDEKYPETFIEELNYQCGRIVLASSVIIIFAWLPYLSLDTMLHPEEPLFLYIRLGLSILGVIMLVLQFLPYFKKKGLALMVIIGVYLELATAVITGLSGGDSVYIGGYLFILMLIPLVPFPRIMQWGLVAGSAIVFFAAGLSRGMKFVTMKERYSLNDIIMTVLVSSIFIYILDKIRFKSWQKSKMIENQKMDIIKDKENIDKLLLNMLPSPIADELKNQGYVKPICYSSSTIVFTDFVDFTKIMETMTPDDLILELHKYFSFFDSMMEMYNLEKLKTIGDIYMYAGGMPETNSTHAVDAVMGALEMLDYMGRVNRAKEAVGKPPWNIRIGINTGALVAGIVGEKKFVYDVWGDAVNIASRIESSGEPGKVNISNTTLEAAQDFFDMEYRGKIMAKNKGVVDVFSVKGIRAALSVNGEGNAPNDEFRKLYDGLKTSRTPVNK
ncbi:MAG: adenylate/guanylate cyclase domain-containing protein [Spirochaetes bacterium]|jgi:class 3 adenylate cyclase|nr:adenylate/guanylate cyclase domain-containing protein [Spirochaetota bacterium]